ncbi:MAG: haloacid dehalogenase-like hydrolase [Alicyclobacillus herbarius]|uniref:HAD family hydrolase n=1 Tax=Alicyclobacillus herbarius TaxID=122960 RepID=UPI0023560624|nr:HAD family hydrolase [Alicyclobacillus herbarius]MCL6632682.1 haloacid dehalogenase-like hydrolase [Alicyclobacillus herbarius]
MKTLVFDLEGTLVDSSRRYRHFDPDHGLKPGHTQSESQAQASLLMPGARQVLETLRERGHTLTIASNCGQAYLDWLLDAEGLRDLFVHPLCLESVRGRTKADTLAAHIARFGRSGMVMIGDRPSDIRAAKAHNLDSVGCAFTLSAADLRGATYIIHALTELLDLFP